MISSLLIFFENFTKIFFYPISFIKLIISIAENAASAPLFPAFVPALSIASSILFVVKTPKITGSSLCNEIWATPFETSAQT